MSIYNYSDNTLNLPTVTDSEILEYFKRNKVLTTSKYSNTKISKSNESSDEYRTAYVALLPADYSREANICPRSKYCKSGCIFQSGQNTLDKPILSKYFKTLYFSRFRELFLQQLYRELSNFSALCQRLGVKAAVRLNTYSDIPYESIASGLFGLNIQYYDYTKLIGRFSKPLPDNYDLTYSLVAAETTFYDIHDIATIRQIRCSAVFSRESFKTFFAETMPKFELYSSGIGSVTTVSGESHDMTFKHDKGIVLILKDKSPSGQDNPLVYKSTRDFMRVIR